MTPFKGVNTSYLDATWRLVARVAIGELMHTKLSEANNI
jgi:hypothetical protein